MGCYTDIDLQSFVYHFVHGHPEFTVIRGIASVSPHTGTATATHRRIMVLMSFWRPSQWFLGTGAFISGEQGNKDQILRGTKTILGNMEHKKTIFDFWGTGEQANLFQGTKGIGTPHPLGVPHSGGSLPIHDAKQRSFEDVF